MVLRSTVVGERSDDVALKLIKIRFSVKIIPKGSFDITKSIITFHHLKLQPSSPLIDSRSVSWLATLQTAS
jgi:hypothetical protein